MVNRSQAGRPVQPARHNNRHRIFTDGCHLQAVTAETRSPGIFPVTLSRSPSATAFFPAGTATSCCPEKKYAPPRFTLRIPQGQAVTLRRHPVFT